MKEENRVTVKPTETEAEKVRACIMLAIADDRYAILREQSDCDRVQKVRYYERLNGKLISRGF